MIKRCVSPQKKFHLRCVSDVFRSNCPVQSAQSSQKLLSRMKTLRVSRRTVDSTSSRRGRGSGNGDDEENLTDEEDAILQQHRGSTELSFEEILAARRTGRSIPRSFISTSNDNDGLANPHGHSRETEDGGDGNGGNDDENEEDEEEERGEGGGEGVAGSRSRTRDQPRKLKIGKHSNPIMARLARSTPASVVRRDPRFDSLCGEFSESGFRQSFSFLDDVRESELADLKKQLRKAKSTESRRLLDQRISKLGVQIAAESRKRAAQTAIADWRKEEIEKIRTTGKSPFFLKKQDEKKLIQRAEFQALSQPRSSSHATAASSNTRKLDAVIAKRRKRVAAREKRFLPRERRSAQDSSNS
eukprot:ANDGO_01262.mRNA.1 rRNA biogenesis protein RRP36